MKWKTYAALAFATCLLGTACVEDQSTDKGAEEAPLTDGKADSFYRPTEHGELNFRLANPATMKEDEVFHAWTFTLSGEASVSLQTEVSQNLDTVMYLYHRKDAGSTWGRYLAKNDDHQGNIWSKIEHDGGEGEYRVIVKPFKTSLRGSFKLVGACEGPGCAAPDAGVCVPEEFTGLPPMTEFADGCMTDIANVLASPVKTSTQHYVAYDQHCALQGITQKAVAHYVSWWDDIVGFEDAFASNGLDEIEFNVEHTEHEDGHVVWVDVQMDEDGMRLIYDKEGNLLSVYQSNQSPTVDFFCADPSAELIEVPTAECFSPVQRAFTFSDGDITESDSGQATYDELRNSSIFGVDAAMDDYMSTYEDRFSVGHQFDFEATEYNSEGGEHVTRLTLNTVDEDGDEVPATYHIIDGYNGPILVRTHSSEDRVTCE